MPLPKLKNLFVSETCLRFCAIDLQISFLALAIASKKISKTVNETCAKWSQFCAVSETQGLHFALRWMGNNKLQTDLFDLFLPVVDIIKLFWLEILIFQKLRKWKILVLMSEPALIYENNSIFKQKYTVKLFMAFKMI